MTTLTINAKGQIRLSNDLLTHLHVRVGEEVVVDKLPDRCILITGAKPVKKGSSK
jgi:hypothetical protein